VTISNVRIAELILAVEEKRWEVQPFFQRRLVWTGKDKEFLIDTVLREFPFPEIFVAHKAQGSSLKRPTFLVDGQQRITTLQSYYNGDEEGFPYKTIKRYSELTNKEQQAFLNYEVAVRDLGTVDEATLKEIFRRINSTDYALKTMEVLHAMYSGAYKEFCVALAGNPFFEAHEVFSKSNVKRMYDVTFCVILVATLMGGYYRRDERNAEFLERYNDVFDEQDELQTGLNLVFEFLDDCELPPSSRVWKQTDLFTLLVELYAALNYQNIGLDPKVVGKKLDAFYAEVDAAFKGATQRRPEVVRYLKAATKATNDKYARIDRAEVIAGLLGTQPGPAAEDPPKAAKKTAKKTAKKV
jgi:hypothetical protein